MDAVQRRGGRPMKKATADTPPPPSSSASPFLSPAFVARLMTIAITDS